MTISKDFIQDLIDSIESGTVKTICPYSSNCDRLDAFNAGQIAALNLVKQSIDFNDLSNSDEITEEFLIHNDFMRSHDLSLYRYDKYIEDDNHLMRISYYEIGELEISITNKSLLRNTHYLKMPCKTVTELNNAMTICRF